MADVLINQISITYITAECKHALCVSVYGAWVDMVHGWVWCMSGYGARWYGVWGYGAWEGMVHAWGWCMGGYGAWEGMAHAWVWRRGGYGYGA